MTKKHDVESPLFAVIGLPRSGTTLLSNMLNSFDNSFCLSEPHWAKILNPNAFRLDKLSGHFSFQTNESLMSELQSFTKNSNYTCGGVKETYRIWQPASVMFPYNSQDLSFIFFIFRDPLSVYNSAKKWGGKYCEISNHVTNYTSLANDYLILKKNQQLFTVNGVVPNLVSGTAASKSEVTPVGICYENLCSGGVDYLKNQLLVAGIDVSLKHSGSFEIKPTDFIFGDPSANKGGKIGQPVISRNNLSMQEGKILETTLRPIYTSVVDTMK